MVSFDTCNISILIKNINIEEKLCILVYKEKKVIFISTVRVDKRHLKLLDKLISHLTLRGKKISKKDLIAKLIEEAMTAEGLEENESPDSIIDDYAWKGLDNVFELGIKDLSEKVDEVLYQINEEE